MHVDGFRFDLASILSRDESGRPLPNPPVLWDIESDPLLAGTKLIAEAWDAAGLVSGRQLRRRRVAGMERPVPRRRAAVSSKGDDELGAGRWPTRLLGSPDIYGHQEREAEQSINFVTCHDGFTLNDLVSYNQKHNEANGEDNSDGSNDNVSWNCGVEGPTDDPGDRGAAQPSGQELPRDRAAGGRHADAAHGRRGPAHAARQQQRLLSGQRDQLVRLDACSSGIADIHRFVQTLNRVPPAARRRDRKARRSRSTSSCEPGADRVARRRAAIVRTGANTRIRSRSRCAACTRRFLLHGMFNAYWEPLTFELPPVPAGPSSTGGAASTPRWRRPTTSPPGRRHRASRTGPTSWRPVPACSWRCRSRARSRAVRRRASAVCVPL